ncbi:hypothetical protein J3E74DRAFT_353687 [Bipolaris maydis]|nr:hypothetical protein J3E74DRAFT_353687 [Bipolaris maydis]
MATPQILRQSCGRDLRTGAQDTFLALPCTWARDHCRFATGCGPSWSSAGLGASICCVMCMLFSKLMVAWVLCKDRSVCSWTRPHSMCGPWFAPKAPCSQLLTMPVYDRQTLQTSAADPLRVDSSGPQRSEKFPAICYINNQAAVYRDMECDYACSYPTRAAV